jgi:lipopolysaccharide heptosyltransferase I
MRVLIVRLSSLGDVVHTIPVAAALRRRFPAATIDWVVGAASAELLALVTAIDEVIVLPPAPSAWLSFGLALRRRRYDVALDVQGLGKSAAVARLSGAARVVGFAGRWLREPWARWLYTERVDPLDPGPTGHVIARNLGILDAVGVRDVEPRFPIAPVADPVVEAARARVGGNAPFAVINPSAAWATKCWPAGRFGAVAAHLDRRHGVRTAVVWGPSRDDESRAAAVVAASAGAAVLAPPTRLGALATLLRAACLMVSGDTGPLHLAAALGTPVVGLYGPSDPARNGPWSPVDEVVSVAGACRCLRRRAGASGVGMVRRCAAPARCLDGVTVADVCAAVDRRLAVLTKL